MLKDALLDPTQSREEASQTIAYLVEGIRDSMLEALVDSMLALLRSGGDLAQPAELDKQRENLPRRLRTIDLKRGKP